MAPPECALDERCGITPEERDDENTFAEASCEPLVLRPLKVEIGRRPRFANLLPHDSHVGPPRRQLAQAVFHVRLSALRSLNED
jgi:hypothetical protein